MTQFGDVRQSTKEAVEARTREIAGWLRVQGLCVQSEWLLSKYGLVAQEKAEGK